MEIAKEPAQAPLLRAIITQAFNGYVVEIQRAFRDVAHPTADSYASVYLTWAQIGAPIISKDISEISDILAAYMMPSKPVTVKL